MSHVATVDIEIKDLESLAKAAERCGLELVRDQKTFRWYGRWMNDYAASDAAYKLLGIDPNDYGKCDHAIRVKNGSGHEYEIGVCKRPDGKGWALLWDFYAGGHGLMKHIAAEAHCRDGGKLQQAYAVEVAKKAARKQGFVVREKIVEGKIQLMCTR